jgi:hypothetical protein
MGASTRRLAELGPSLVLPGHGDAVRDMGAFERFVSTLPHGAAEDDRSIVHAPQAQGDKHETHAPPTDRTFAPPSAG